MKEKVKATIAKYHMLSSGDKVLIGVSGGPDSIALAHVLMRISEEMDFSLHIAHLNHMFRGKEAEKDAESVIRFSEKRGLPYTVEKQDVPAYLEEHKVSAQVGARKIRYSFFEKLAAETGANKIATGHQADDQAETVMINLLRGTGLAGLTGIPPVREGKYIRPLIEVSREEIDRYCKENDLPVRFDQSNKKNIYLRNKVRNQLMPFIRKEFNPRITEVLNRLSYIVKEDNDFIDAETNRTWRELIIEKERNKVVLDLTKFLELAVAIQRRILLKGWKQINNSERDIGFIHIEELLVFLRDTTTTGIFELPKGVKVRKVYLKLELFKGEVQSTQDFQYSLKVPGDTIVPELGIKVETDILEGTDIKDLLAEDRDKKEVYVDYGILPGEIYVRNRRPGDRFQPLGMKGSKKIKDYFIDKKVPSDLRDRYPIIVSGGKIVWVGGMHLDDRWKITKNTTDVLRIKITSEVNS